ncbi:GNAT family N-acetyltransferase [Inediibacterium massiliense]|uniref:GNAT family N-acetyltransferase n=1 Tax=Inediibacterium massiliense TaxID=1658111 RepID=UPI0006B648F8|nr:GNAT family N-acetyltransferase [Inediibacterium massiliense]
MLEIKPATENEIQVIEQLVGLYDIDLEDIKKDISNCMIAYDNEIPVGAGGFNYQENQCSLSFVVVKKERQNEYLGDAIVKSVLNLANYKGIQKVYVNPKEYASFFEKLRFKKDDADKNLLFVTLPDYFLQGCKHKK